MAKEPPERVRHPEVRRSLLRDVLALTRPTTTAEGEVAFGDAVEEVHHLLNPAHGGEPGDVLLEDEVVAASELWRALSDAPWPLNPADRRLDPAWDEVTALALSFLDAVR